MEAKDSLGEEESSEESHVPERQEISIEGRPDSPAEGVLLEEDDRPAAPPAPSKELPERKTVGRAEKVVEDGDETVPDLRDELPEPTEEAVQAYAQFLGLDPKREAHLLWIARLGVVAPVPEPWKANKEADAVFYFNHQTGESIWDHPTDEHYRGLLEKYRELGPERQPKGAEECAAADRAFHLRGEGSSPKSARSAIPRSGSATPTSQAGHDPFGGKMLPEATPPWYTRGNWTAGRWLEAEAKKFSRRAETDLKKMMMSKDPDPPQVFQNLGDLIMKRAGLDAQNPAELVGKLDECLGGKLPLRDILAGCLSELEDIIMHGFGRLMTRQSGIERKNKLNDDPRGGELAMRELHPRPFTWGGGLGPAPNSMEELVGPSASNLVLGLVREHWEASDSQTPFDVGMGSEQETSRSILYQVVLSGGRVSGARLEPDPQELERFRQGDIAPSTTEMAQRITAILPELERDLMLGGEVGLELTAIEDFALALLETPLHRKYQAALRRKSNDSVDWAALEKLCGENTFTTTLHLIQSGLTKLSWRQIYPTYHMKPTSCFFLLPMRGLDQSWTEYCFVRCYTGLDEVLRVLEDSVSEEWTIVEVMGAVQGSQGGCLHQTAWLPAISDVQVTETSVEGPYDYVKAVAHPRSMKTIDEGVDKMPEAVLAMRNVVKSQVNFLADSPSWSACLNQTPGTEEAMRHALLGFSEEVIEKIEERYLNSAMPIQHAFRGEVRALIDLGLDLEAQHPGVLEAMEESIREEYPEVAQSLGEALTEIKKDAGMEESSTFEVTCGTEKPFRLLAMDVRGATHDEHEGELWILEHLSLKRRDSSIPGEAKFFVASVREGGTEGHSHLPATVFNQFTSWELVAIQGMKDVESQLLSLQEKWQPGQQLSLTFTFRRDLLPEEVGKRAREHGSTYAEEGQDELVVAKLVRLFNFNSCYKELILKDGKLANAGDRPVEESEALLLIRAVASALHINTLHLQDCPFSGDIVAMAIANTLQAQPKPLITSLRLSGLTFSSRDCEARAGLLVHCATHASLEVLQLSACELTDEDGQMLISMLGDAGGRDSKLIELDLSSNLLENLTLDALLHFLTQNAFPKLKRVKLGNNRIPQADLLVERFPDIQWQGLSMQIIVDIRKDRLQASCMQGGDSFGRESECRHHDESDDVRSEAAFSAIEERPEFEFLEDKEDDRYTFLEEINVKFTVSPHRPNKKGWLLVVLGLEMAGGMYVVTKSDQYLDTAGQRQSVAMLDADRTRAKGHRLMGLRLRQPEKNIKEAVVAYLNAPPVARPSPGDVGAQYYQSPGYLAAPGPGPRSAMRSEAAIRSAAAPQSYDAGFRSAAAQSRLSPMRASPMRHQAYATPTPVRHGPASRTAPGPPASAEKSDTTGGTSPCKIDQQCADIQMQAITGSELEVTLLFGRPYTSEELHERIRSFTKAASQHLESLDDEDEEETMSLQTAVEKRIGQIFKANHDFMELGYSGEVLAPFEATSIVRALPKASKLACLNLEAIGLGSEGCDKYAIVDGLFPCQSLINVRLSMNSFGDGAGRALFDTLAAKETLEELELARCDLGDDILPESMPDGFPNLRVLDLRGNGLGPRFASAFAALLRRVHVDKKSQKNTSPCKKLQTLRLSENRFAGESELAMQLGMLTSLEELRMYKCGLGDEAGAAFFRAVAEAEGSSNLRILDFYDNGLGRATAGQLRETLQLGDKLNQMKLFWFEDNFFDARSRQMLLSEWAKTHPLSPKEDVSDLLLRMRFGRQFEKEGSKKHDVEEEQLCCSAGTQETLNNDPTQEEYNVEAWTGEKWLSTVDLNDVIAAAMEFPREKQDEHLSRMTKADLQVMLEKANLAGLTEKLWEQVRRFRMQEAPDTKRLNAKFQKEGSYSLSLGTLDVFFKGLTGLVGPPRQVNGRLDTAMKEEHLSQRDSREYFKSSNGVETTSEIEWKFVDDPRAYEAEGKKWPDRFEEGTEEARKPRDKETLLAILEKKNKELLEANCTPVQWPEFIAGILYTGPMYEKYNLVLRAESGVPFLVSRRKALCHNNKYPTTIHGINSCIIKLSKLTRVNVLWRGSTGAKLPRSFFEEDKFGLKGGIEYGFTSMTTEQKQARHYAKGKASTLFRARMGMVNRGAEMKDLSQYPFEAEILFPPLLGMEITDTSVEGSSLLLHTSLSLNLMSETLDQVETKRFKLLQDTAANMEMEILRACMESDASDHGPAARFARSAFDTLMQKEPKWYNDDDHFADTVLSLVDIKKDVWPMTKNKTGDRLLAAANSFHQKHGCEQVDHLNFAGKLLRAAKLPEYIWAFRRAKVLNLENAGIAVLTEATLDHVLGLEKLILKGAKNLKELPESIGRLQQLEVLDLGRSGVERLPDCLFLLRQLKVLDLTACEIKYLNFAYLDKAPAKVEFGLQKLILKEMKKLKELPMSIGRLKQLRVLDLSKSAIARLPETLFELGQKEKKLQTLDLTGATSLKETKLEKFLAVFEPHPKSEGRGSSSSDQEPEERKYKVKQVKTSGTVVETEQDRATADQAEAQKERIRKVFLMLDPERSGKIPLDQFSFLLEQLNMQQTDLTYWIKRLRTQDGIDYVTFLDQVMSVLPLA